MCIFAAEIATLCEALCRTKYKCIMYIHERDNWTQFFSDISITEENGIPYLNALFKGKKPICERILKLDAERYQKGDLPLSNLLSKYCSYIVAGNRE